ncbi:MAG: prenyltransferase/squalene oxidase repeat-containing protein [Pirellulaceae bacterium]
MAVRLWLLVADCWQCGTSIELSAEYEREASRLLHSHSTTPVKPAPSTDEPLPPQTEPPGRRSTDDRLSSPRPAREPCKREEWHWKGGVRGASRPPRTLTHSPPSDAGTRLARERSRRAFQQWLDNLLRDLPAWLMSLLLNLVILALLGLLTFGQKQEDQFITLSAAVGTPAKVGDAIAQLSNEPRFDLPVPEEEVPHSEQELRALIKAEQDARPLRLDPDQPNPYLPHLDVVKSAVQSGNEYQRTLSVRDPRLRVKLIHQEGGTTRTEAAVARGLMWLASQQSVDGSWSLDRRTGRTAATSLALLPFLGAGQTHQVGVYQETVAGGLNYLLRFQQRDGDLRGDAHGNQGMYVHGQSTIVLCEAYAMTHDVQLRDAAQLAVDFIVASQHPAGGWRYQPGQPGDTSVLGWQLMALQSARAASLRVPDHTLELADQYLDTVRNHDGTEYSYQPGREPTHVMSAEAFLCRMYLGWRLDRPGFRQGVEKLLDRHPPDVDDPDIYYWYYATQVLHHMGGTSWERWNKRMRDVLVNTQVSQGRNAGSWEPRGPFANEGGRIYMTSLAVCTLEVYYRHAPIFRQIDL